LSFKNLNGIIVFPDPPIDNGLDNKVDKRKNDNSKITFFILDPKICYNNFAQCLGHNMGSLRLRIH